MARSEDDAAEEKSIGGVIDKFGTRTSIHGISHYYQRSGTNGRWWILCAIIGIAITVVHLYYHAQNFFSVPVKTNVVHKSHSFEFPDVTMCSTSPLVSELYFKANDSEIVSGGYTERQAMALGLLYSYSELNQSNFDKDRMLHQRTIYLQMATDHTHDRGYKQEELIADCRYQGEKCASHEFHATTNSNYFNCYTFTPKNRTFDSVEPEDGLVLIVNTHSSTMKELRDYREKRNSADGSLLIDSYQATKMRHGLSTSDTFASMLTPENEPNGLKIEIHAPQTTPHTRQRGFILSNGRYIEIGVDMLIEHSLDTPSKPCRSDDYRLAFRQFVKKDGTINAEKHKKTYTDCVALVKQHYFIEKCKCLSHFFPVEYPQEAQMCYNYSSFLDRVLEEVDKTSTIKMPPKSNNFSVYVNFTNDLTIANSVIKRISEEFRQQLKCHDDTYKDKALLGNLVGLPECLTSLPCTRPKYSWTWSSADWPRDFDLEHLMNNTFINSFRNNETNKLSRTASLFVNFTDNNKNWNTTDEVIRKNFLKVIIHPMDLLVNVHMEETTYTVWEALSEIGGILGLWIGMSLLAVCEIVELICNLMCFMFRSDKQKRRDKQKSSNDGNETVQLAPGDPKQNFV